MEVFFSRFSTHWSKIVVVRKCVCIVIFSTGLCAQGIGATTTNLIRNGSFEMISGRDVHNEAAHWKMGQPDDAGDCWGSAARENWRAHEGKHIGAIRGLWAGCGSDGGFWQDTKAVPGQTYRFSGYFYCDPEWVARTQEMKIEFWDEKKKTLIFSETRPIVDCFMTWEKLSIQATAPEGAAWVRVVVNVSNTGSCGSLQLDDLELIPVPADQPLPN